MSLPSNHPNAGLIDEVSKLLHSEQPFVAARLVREWVAQSAPDVAKHPLDTRAQAFDMLNILLHWCLGHDAPERAAQMLWGPTLFSAEPECTQRVWRAFEEHNFILLMGGASITKSYSMGVRLFLEWLRDPEHTTIRVLGPSEEHLESNLFTHLVTLHQRSTIPLPGEVGKLFIGLNKRARKSSISGVVIPLGKKAAGRLQGVKRVPRKKPHPEFGIMSRLFVFLDEVANIPKGVWKDTENLMSNTSGDGFKLIGAFNPSDQTDEVGVRCEPPFGWGSFDPDTHFEWTSTRGWRIIRLDPSLCENVVQRKELFPGLQTYEGLQQLILASGGIGSPGYWTMGRGCFPPVGMAMSVIPAGVLSNFKAEPIWYETPEPCAGVDLALEGSDNCALCAGRFGLASALKFPASLSHPTGHIVWFTDRNGVKVPRNILLVDQIFRIPRGDTVSVKAEILKLARTLRIKPEFLAVDRTGNGQGVYDLLRFEWSPAVTGVNFFEGASETRIMVEDKDTAKELYDRVQTELWFAARKWLEFGYTYGALGLCMEELTPQLTGRLFRGIGKKSRVESKKDFKSRHGNKSPDEADAFTLLVHAARKGSGFVPGMVAGNSEEPGEEDDGYNPAYVGGVRVDETNRFDNLD